MFCLLFDAFLQAEQELLDIELSSSGGSSIEYNFGSLESFYVRDTIG